MSVKNRAQRAKGAVVREAAVHGSRALSADSPGEYLGMQIDEARELSRKQAGDEYLAEHERYRRRQRREPGVVARAGQNVDLVGLAIALVIVGVVMYVGLNVMSTTEQSTGLDTSADAANRTQFENASVDLTGGISDAYSLSGILFLVLILTGVVGLLLGLRARRG